MMREDGQRDVYDRFLPRPTVDNARDLNAFQIRQISTETRKATRSVSTVILPASITSNLILTVVIIYITCFTQIRYFDNNGESGEESSMVSRADTAFNRTNICLHCRPPKTRLGVSSASSLCCYHSNEYTILLIKLLLGQKQNQTRSSYGQYEVTPTSDERAIHLKSTLKRTPTSLVVPATANRIQILETGHYNLFGSMCFSEKDFRENPKSVAIKLETLYSGFKKTILQKTASVHWDPNAYVYVNFMDNIWLQNGTDVLLFVSHPNVIYKLPDCNSIGIYKST